MNSDRAHEPNNQFSGDAETVVQVRTVLGGVHVHREASLPSPRQLPAPVSCFTNRADYIDRLEQLLNTEDSPSLIIVSGLGAVGKTALCVYWAHQQHERFPDGQLYVNLHGYGDTPPVGPAEVLDGFLRALNVLPSQIPQGLDAMAGLYRSLLASRRMLVVLDNASHAEQIRPLVGSAPGCLTLVTSRSTLAGLVAREGAIPIRLEPLDPEQALVLFRRVSGRVGELDSNHAQLMQYCGYLPLTIRIMACQAADREEGIDNLVQELASTPKKLSAFVTTDGDEMVEVRKVFRASYRALASDAARAFRLLGAHPGPDVTADAAAALFDVDVAVAKQLLGVLVDANMLERPHRGRYAFHDLVREYATEVAAEEPSEDLLAAQRRELMFYLGAADTADRMLAPNRRHVPLEPGDAVGSPPIFGTHAAALAWCEIERPNLMAAIDLAGSLGFFDIAWKLPVALIYYFALSNHRVNRLTASRAALTAARALGDTHAEQWCLTCLGGAELDLEQTEDAIEHFAAALDICRVIGDVQGQGIHLSNIAHALHQLGQIRQALSAALDSLERLRQVEDRRSEAITLVGLGHIAVDLGELVDAGEYFRQAEVISDYTDLPTQGDIQHGTGRVSLKLGDLGEAVARFSAAVDLHRRAGDRRRLANSLAELGGSLMLRDGRTDTARAALVEAAHLFEELADPRAAALRQELEEL